MSPILDNMISYYFYKGLSMLYKNQGSFDDNQIFYSLTLRFISMFFTCLFIHVPLTFLVESIYKKNSNTLKTLLVALLLTTCTVFQFMSVEIDFQAILATGFTLWS